MVQCVAHGLLGNALDAAISCLVYAYAAGASAPTWIEFAGLPDIVGGTYPWHTVGLQFDEGGIRVVGDNRKTLRKSRVSKCLELNGQDGFLQRCSRDALRQRPGLASGCASSQPA